MSDIDDMLLRESDEPCDRCGQLPCICSDENTGMNEPYPERRP